MDRLCPIHLSHHGGYTCNEINTCPTGEPRTEDPICSCPDPGFAQCTKTPCKSGVERSASTCKCMDPPKNVVQQQSVNTSYSGEDEKVKITWDTDGDLSIIHDFEVLINGKKIPCNESREERVAT